MANIVPFPKLEDFLEKVKERGLRTVRLQDEGLVEPRHLKNEVIVMQPMVRIVATAYDLKANEILKWEEKGEAHRMVTIHAGTGRGQHGDPKVAATRQDLHDILVTENLQVEPGEWTPESIASLRAVRKKIG